MPPLVPGGGHASLGEREWGSPNSDEGNTLGFLNTFCNVVTVFKLIIVFYAFLALSSPFCLVLSKQSTYYVVVVTTRKSNPRSYLYSY